MPQFPEVTGDGVRARIVTGSAFGKTSPVKTTSDTLFVDARLAAGASMQAKAEWKSGRLGIVPGDVEEFVPSPES